MAGFKQKVREMTMPRNGGAPDLKALLASVKASKRDPSIMSRIHAATSLDDLESLERVMTKLTAATKTRSRWAHALEVRRRELFKA